MSIVGREHVGALAPDSIYLPLSNVVFPVLWILVVVTA